MKTITFPVIVHSCLLKHDLVFEDKLLPEFRYISMGEENDKDPWYRTMAKKCLCRKLVTYAVADDMLNKGVAEPVWKIKKKNIERVEKEVWMVQQVMVPRVDLSTEADIQRAFVDLNPEYIQYIEDIHQMYMENRQKLIVPFMEEKHLGDWPKPCIDPKNPKELMSGRLLFPFPRDERTFGGHSGR